MNQTIPMTPRRARKLLKKLDAQWAAIDARLDKQQQQPEAIERLRELCAPFLRENPQITVGEVLALLQQCGHGKPN